MTPLTLVALKLCLCLLSVRLSTARAESSPNVAWDNQIGLYLQQSAVQFNYFEIQTDLWLYLYNPLDWLLWVTSFPLVKIQNFFLGHDLGSKHIIAGGAWRQGFLHHEKERRFLILNLLTSSQRC